MAFGFQKGKYGASWVTAPDGTKFASKGEFARWNFLVDMQACGKITGLRRQIRFKLEVKGQLICTYIADHGYSVVLDEPFLSCPETIEDFKGMETPEFKLKKKLMLAIHGIDVKVVKKPTAGYK